ncbi:hypothetical protein NGM99_05010 [Mesorhizobium sp. RP14(2022)]|uniref:LPXTG cell wall anchor domain-containing protein n=1 Tax=Mesorhizobium liriopis TaxID=2953882 RepID=A0ABT1C2Z2_9HYPH|nr:hypothetical protein [Mesorhizobium liriopis]MCO6049147.1 hypothetical protein [Mesorhizobium liriopis]
MTKPRSLLLGAACALTLAASPALALGGWPGGPGGPGKGGPKGPPTSHAVPGPVAGLGIPVVLAAGSYAWFVRRRRRNVEQHRKSSPDRR